MSSGLFAQVGYKLEATVNVPVTVTDFMGLVDESMKREQAVVKSKAIYAGRRVMLSEQHAAGNETLAGTISHELTNKGCETAMSMVFGVPTKTGAGPYTRTYDSRTLLGVTATIQGARPDTTGVVNPFTWTGCKSTGAEISLAVGEFATFSTDIAAMNEILVRVVADGVTNSTATVTSASAAFTAEDVGKPITGSGIPAATYVGVINSATSIGLSSTQSVNTPIVATLTAGSVSLTIGIALATASYLSSIRPYTFVQGTLLVGALTPPNVKKATLKTDTGLDVGRRGIGSAKIAQPLEADLRSYKVSLDCEFDSLAHYRRYIAQTEHAFSLALVAGADTLTFSGNGYYEMPPEPKVSGPGIVRQTIALDLVASGADSTALQCVMVNAVA